MGPFRPVPQARSWDGSPSGGAEGVRGWQPPRASAGNCGRRYHPFGASARSFHLTDPGPASNLAPDAAQVCPAP
eukprot:13864714-Alexandrium_andersonii.AAC.1